MFSFFKRNKSRPNPNNTNNKNNNNDVSNANKASVNMQLAIEKQQASLHQVLEQKRKNDVNDREQKDVSSYTASGRNDDEDEFKNRSAPVSECGKSNVLAAESDTCAAQKHQNYDQFRDSKRSSFFLYDSIEYSSRQGTAPINYYQPKESCSPTVVASSIKDQKCSAIVGTSSSNAYNSVYEVMGRGRNRNKHRASGPTLPQNHNKNVVKSPRDDDERASKNVNDCREVASENLTKVEAEVRSEKFFHKTPNNAASAEENSEQSASISSENVLHDENSCSINNENDNIAASDEQRAAENIVSADAVRSENSVTSYVKNDEQSEQQVGAPLQRSASAKRVTFAPSPPRSVASSASDDEEETISSEDIFYEATEAPGDTQKLKILSTVTSHHTRIDEKPSLENDASTSSGESSCSSFNNSNDVVCAKIILSVNENEKNKLSDNGDKDSVNNNAFSSDETSFSSDIESAPKKVKPSYLLVGEDTIALPDIVAETSLFEQHHQADEM